MKTALEQFQSSILIITSTVAIVGAVLLAYSSSTPTGAAYVSSQDYSPQSNPKFQKDPPRYIHNVNCPGTGLEYCTSKGCACTREGSGFQPIPEQLPPSLTGAAVVEGISFG